MLVYLLKRIGLTAIIVIMAVTLLYGMILSVPGDPLSILLGPKASPEMQERLRAKMGLDKPFVVQIALFFANVIRGDLGTDVFTNRPIRKIIFEQLPYTIVLIIFGISWAVMLGIPLGCYSAVNRNSLFDKITGLFSVGVIAIPAFVVSIYSLLIFAVILKWFPAVGAGIKGDLFDQFKHLILPAFSIGLGWVGYIARLVRASMLELLNENHVRTARAYGLTERIIIFKYILRLAILPTISVLGIGVGILLSVSVFAEIIFARPGIGKLIYDAVILRNYPLVLGCVLITTFLFVLCTTVADILTAFLDPRIRESL
jgi:peptide/nickel transport system permease protein